MEVDQLIQILITGRVDESEKKRKAEKMER
jgi:hypothetical protein